MKTQSATQQFVPIADIHDDVVILKDGQICTVLLASSINFGLKSIDEQQAILSQFQSFLNSIDFSIQIYIQSRRLDIRPYLEKLEARTSLQENDLMRIQLREYIEFISTFTNQVDIMTKNFFVVIPYTPLNLEITGISRFIPQKPDQKERSAEKFFEDRTQLELRVSVVEQGLMRIGIRTAPLGTEELVELFYHIFNPEDASNAPKQ
jgi:type IV secretory pathway VirB4 component